jgi:hypothetical protein
LAFNTEILGNTIQSTEMLKYKWEITLSIDKMSREVAPVVDGFPNMHRAFISNSSTIKTLTCTGPLFQTPVPSKDI